MAGVEMKGKKILITGVKGLIGSSLYDMLRVNNEVSGYDKVSGIIDKLLVREFDIIFHCAANTIIRECIDNTQLAIDNINCTIPILEYCKKHKNTELILFSSSRVTSYEKDNRLMNQYVAAKIFVENITETYCKLFGVKYVIIRPECVFGENDNPKRVIPIWIDSALKNKDIIIFGDLKKILHPVHVEDFNDCLLKTYKTYFGKKVNITGEEITAKELAEFIIVTSESKSQIIYKSAEVTQPQEPDTGDIAISKDIAFKRLKKIIMEKKNGK